MRQSIGLVILQIVGIALGLFSVFWIAGSLPPEIYAVVGIYNVISTFIVVFSNTGFETFAIRNVLIWKETGETEKIRLIVTQALTYRTILAFCIFLPMIGYAFYISTTKFQNQYLGLFLLMGLLSITKATNDATVLILRSFNKYFVAALITYSINVFGKILALILFFKYGFNLYIITIILLPFFITLPALYLVKEWISFKGIFVKTNLIESFKQSKSFALSAYISYLYSFFDQLIISIFMSPEILGSFTVAKNLFAIAKTFIENIFDPMIQNLVRFKNNIDKLQHKLKRILKIRNVLLIASVLFLPFIIIYIDKGLILLRLNHYPFLKYFTVIIYLSQIAHIGMKVKYNFITLFYQSSFYLKLTIIFAGLSIFFFITITAIDVKLAFLYTVITNSIIMIYTNYLFKRKNPYLINIKQ